MFREVSETDVVISPGFRFDAIVSEPGLIYEDNTVAMGNITLEVVFRFFPAPYSIATGEASVDVVQGILEDLLTNVYSPTAFSQSGGWVDGFSGVQTSIAVLTKPGVAGEKFKRGRQVVNVFFSLFVSPL